MRIKSPYTFTDDEKLEILRDIASFANSGGGSVIFGINTTEHGQKEKYESPNVSDIVTIGEKILDLCNKHIQEPIEGIEINPRIVKGNPFISIRIPKSLRVPHVVTYKGLLELWSRSEQKRREMLPAEMQDVFGEELGMCEILR